MNYEQDDTYRCQECNHRITASEFFFCNMTCDDCCTVIEQQQKASQPGRKPRTRKGAK